MSSNVTLRIPKGSRLSYVEGDTNFQQILKLFRFTEDMPVVSGTSDAIELTSSVLPITALSNGAWVGFVATATTTTTTPTVNVDGTGAVVVEANDGTALPTEAIKAGEFVLLRYNGATNTFRTLITPIVLGDGVDSVVAGEGIDVDTNDPLNPIISKVLPQIATEATTSRNLTLADNDMYIRFTHTDPSFVTVPADVDQSFAIGSEIHFRAVTAGTVTIVPAGGVTVNVPDSGGLILGEAGATCTIKKVGTDEWDLFGLVTA